ncbi:MAG TPA: AAA family ATPase [Candidatus Binatia bacterium]|nr:AAA family ATPase [Candidatus Binatia bacterium]
MSFGTQPRPPIVGERAFAAVLRQRRRIRLILTWLAIGFGIYLFLAWMIGADINGATNPDGSPVIQSVAPTQATRNIATVLPQILRTIFPLLLYGVIFISIAMLQLVGIFWLMSRGVSYTVLPGEFSTNFQDVRGMPHVVDATREVMNLFQGYKQFRRVGAYPPHGILFEGPPGTGKTLLAKAIAGETGVPFMYASGAGFANMFLGIPQLRIRMMFRKARLLSNKWGGCVIFVDELDSIGEARGAVSVRRSTEGRDGLHPQMIPGMFGSGGMGMVNMLLTQMDGIEQLPRYKRFIRRSLHLRAGAVRLSNLLVIGATNRAATLDPALLRPGRFDRKIHVGLPDEEGRKDIIAYYLKKVAHDPIDIDRVSRATSGYSGARIKSIVNEAIIFALQDGRESLNYSDIWKAKLTDEIGLAEPTVYSDRERYATAIHESGHAVAAHFLRPWAPVEVISIRKRGGVLGLVHSQDDEERHASRRSEVLTNLRVSLAGMVAEEIWLGESTEGTAGDLASATRQVVRMLAHTGMGSQLVSMAPLQGRTLGDDFETLLSDPELRAEADRILHSCKDEVRTLLEEKRGAVEAVCQAVMTSGELSGDEFRTLLWQIGAIEEKPRTLPQLPVTPGYARGNGHPPGNGYPSGNGYPGNGHNGGPHG